MSDSFWLTTERLALRRLGWDDLEWLVRLRADADVMRYAGGPQPRAKTEELFRRDVLDYYDANPGLGAWLTVERGRDRPVGLHILNHIRGESFIQLGYFLQPDVWGKGYATEMALPLVKYAFETLRLSELVAITALDHAASQHVLNKVGFERRGERAFRHPFYQGKVFAWFECPVPDADQPKS